MSWATIEVLYGLWGLPLLALLLWLALRSRRRALSRLGALLASRTSAGSVRVHRSRSILFVAAVALIIVAMARPQWGYRWQELKSDGVSVVVVLDVSRSMDAEDVAPSRMERARREVRDLAGMLAGDRVALVLSAGGAFPQMFLTLDYTTFDRLARKTDTTSLRAQGSDLGAAIDKAVELLSGSEGDRAILLISDGEDQIGEGVAAAQRAAEQNIRLYTLGVGTPEGAPIPLPEGGFLKWDNEVVITRLDETSLQNIAAAGSGAYVRSVAGAGDIKALYLDEIRGTLSGAEQGVRREKIWTERYQWFLAGAFFLLVIGHGLRPGRLRLTGTGAALLLLVLTGPAQAQDGADSAVIDRLIAEQIDRPDDLALAERLGAALLAAGRFEEAAEVLDTIADRSLDPLQRNRARYNAGLAEYGAGRLTSAVEDWQRVLTDDPEHGPAAQNAQAVQAEIAARMQEEEPPQDGSDSEQGEQQDGEQQQSEQSQQDSSDGSSSQDSDSAQSDQQDGQTDGQQAPDDGTTAPDSAEQQPGEAPATPAQPGEEQGDQDGTAAAPGEVPEGEVSEETAMRLLSAVEEGDPRVEVSPESRGGKEW